MKKLIILGAGQYGRVVKENAEAMGIFSKIEFLDDNSDIAVGKLDDIEKTEYDFAFVAIGNPAVRKLLFEKIKKPITIVHPRAIIASSAKIGEGSIIEAGAVVAANAEIGISSIVMSNVVVGHDAKVGNYCQLKYNCTVPERCVVPDETKVNCNEVYQ